MPVKVWQEMIDQHFPGAGWVRLPRDTMEDLLEFRSRRALSSWEATVRTLLESAAADALPRTSERSAP